MTFKWCTSSHCILWSSRSANQCHGINSWKPRQRLDLFKYQSFIWNIFCVGCDVTGYLSNLFKVILESRNATGHFYHQMKRIIKYGFEVHSARRMDLLVFALSSRRDISKRSIHKQMWFYTILPPANCFSYVDKYITRNEFIIKITS